MLTAIRLLCLMFILAAAPLAAAQSTEPLAKPGVTLNSVLARGQVACGVNQEVRGFGYLDPNTGQIRGLEVDLCRALAAAVFGDASAVQLVPFVGDGGQAALEAGELDVLLHTVVWSLTTDARPLLDFGPAAFYSGQTFIVRADGDLQDWPDLDGAVICVADGSVAAASLRPAMIRRGLNYQPVVLPTAAEAMTAFTEGQCQAYSAGLVELENARQRSADPAAYTVWQGRERLYTLETFAPVYRSDDAQWRDIVDWTLLGLVAAEQLGVSSENINNLVRQPDELDAAYTARVSLDVARLLDKSLGLGANLALSNDFMVAVLREVGNYGEIYARHLGASSDLVIGRGLNLLWRDGGLLAAPTWR